MNPFNSLWDWFADHALPWVKELAVSLFQLFLVTFWEWFTVGRFLWAVVSGLIAASVWAVGVVVDSIENLDLDALPHAAGPMLQYYAFLDRFIPVSEAFAGALICFDVWLIVVIFRWIKSFIPTLSN
jgi:hypothetical protein